jgi:hypothetical protein
VSATPSHPSLPDLHTKRDQPLASPVPRRARIFERPGERGRESPQSQPKPLLLYVLLAIAAVIALAWWAMSR